MLFVLDGDRKVNPSSPPQSVLVLVAPQDAPALNIREALEAIAGGAGFPVLESSRIFRRGKTCSGGGPSGAWLLSAMGARPSWHVLLAAAVFVGALLGGAETRAKPWHGVAPPCEEVPERKFYLYDFEAARLCLRGGELLEAAKRRENLRMSQHLGPDLFLQQLLEQHPWRTTDPSEASLYVLPSLFATAHMGACGVPEDELVTRLTDELMASPHYQRRNGSDHLLVLTDRRALALMLHGSDDWYKAQVRKSAPHMLPAFARFRDAAKRMVVGTKYINGALSHGRPFFWSPSHPEGTPRAFTVPHMAPGGLTTCSPSTEGGGGVTCAPMAAEATFEAYKKRRNVTMFFLGEAASRAEATKTKLRPLVIYRLADLHPPNVLVDTSRSSSMRRRTRHSRAPRCNLGAPGGPTAACRLHERLPPGAFERIMRQSLFSIHVRGDDAGSSRVYEALRTGTPQLFLSSGFYDEMAPFKCAVRYNSAFLQVDERAFARDPHGTMAAVLRSLMEEEPQRLWRELWAAQRDAARELLWHVPDSRVGENIVKDAFRALLGGQPGTASLPEDL